MDDKSKEQKDELQQLGSSNSDTTSDQQEVRVQGAPRLRTKLTMFFRPERENKRLKAQRMQGQVTAGQLRELIAAGKKQYGSVENSNLAIQFFLNEIDQTKEEPQECLDATLLIRQPVRAGVNTI